MKVINESGHRLIKMWTDGVPVEEEAVKQLKNISTLPFVTPHIAVMPDVHLGKGATVGSVIPTVGAIIPAAVGVDIGCGMIAVRTSMTSHDLPTALAGLRSAIEAAVPHGRTDNGGTGDRGRWGTTMPTSVAGMWSSAGLNLADRWEEILKEHPKIGGRGATAEHLGTLGTGNHFIEVCLDESDRVWVMLHSGSRGPGNRIGSYFITRAKEEMQKWFISLPDTDLSYLPQTSPLFGDYVKSVRWAQDFASTNRQCMLDAVIGAMKSHLKPQFTLSDEVVSCHHNYITSERHFGETVWVTRKGAVSAKLGELGIIPGSMGTRSYIVRGKGNRDSLCSCSHGAGRKMSRTQAQKTFTLADHAKATAGIECRKDADVIDETPGAYKDIDHVMAAQADLVDIVHTLRQILCVKG